MATDAQNLKLNKVTTTAKSAFNQTVLSSGSIYWDEGDKRVVVGDGSTSGGIPMAGASEVEAVKADVAEVKANLSNYLTTAELEQILKELIVEFGGTIPE